MQSWFAISSLQLHLTLVCRSGKAFILVFAVDNVQSFHDVVNLWNSIKRVRGEYHDRHDDCLCKLLRYVPSQDHNREMHAV